MAYISRKQLPGIGIEWSDPHLWEKIKHGLVPPPMPSLFGRVRQWPEEDWELYFQIQQRVRDNPWIAHSLRAWLKEQTKAGENPWHPAKMDVWFQEQIDSRQRLLNAKNARKVPAGKSKVAP